MLRCIEVDIVGHCKGKVKRDSAQPVDRRRGTVPSRMSSVIARRTAAQRVAPSAIKGFRVALSKTGS